MITFFLISSVAMLVGIVGSIVIWRFDALRAEEIAHTPALVVAPAALNRARPAQNSLEGPSAA